MPLIKSPTEAAFKENIRREMDAGKPYKQAVAIAYSMRREHDRRKGHRRLPQKMRNG